MSHDSSTKTGSYETTRSEIGDRHHPFGVVCRSPTTARAPRGSRWLRILKHYTTRCRATRRRTTSNARIRDENHFVNVRVRAKPRVKRRRRRLYAKPNRDGFHVIQIRLCRVTSSTRTRLRMQRIAEVRFKGFRRFRSRSRCDVRFENELTTKRDLGK